MMTFNDFPTDSEQLIAFFNRSEKKLLQYAYQIVGDWYLAQDAVQNALLQLIKYYDLVRDFDQPRLLKYTLKIISNECSKILRSKHGEVSFDEMSFYDDIDPHNEIDNFYDRIDRQVLKQCVDKLPHTYRIVLCMKYFESANDSEIGAVLDIKPASVRMALKRARAKLMKLYNAAGGDNE